MSLRVSVTVVVALLSTAQWTSAQAVTASDSSPVQGTTDTADAPTPPAVSDDQGIVLPPKPAPDGVTFGAPTPRNPFTSIGHDLKTFFTHRDTAVVIGVFAPAAGVAYTWDQAGIKESQEHLHGIGLHGRQHRRRLPGTDQRRGRDVGDRSALGQQEDEGDRRRFAARPVGFPGGRAEREAGDPP